MLSDVFIPLAPEAGRCPVGFPSHALAYETVPRPALGPHDHRPNERERRRHLLAPGNTRVSSRTTNTGETEDGGGA